MEIKKLKQTLTHLFDDNVPHHGWERAVRIGIVVMIMTSAVLAFVETFENFAAHWRHTLFIVDAIIIGIFSIEIALRIWVGGWKYVFSFYGMVDIWSTYPFYLTFLFPIPYAALRILRVLRLMRILRYMRSSHILVEAVKSKRREMWISIQFLVIITFVLSIMLYHVEHEAQPDVYTDGATSTMWAFAKYIGDPGDFADYSPVTIGGKIIACLVGLLGIAIFAVPAGIIGSAFVDVMDEEKKSEENRENMSKIRSMFRRRQCRDTYLRTCSPYHDITSIQVKLMLGEQEIIDAVSTADDLRLINLGNTYPQGVIMPSKLAVEHFPINTEYGVCVDRGSNVTIIATSCILEPCLSWVGWYLALFGGFNFVGKQLEKERITIVPNSFYNIPLDPEKRDPVLKHFIKDIESMKRPGMRNYNICLLTSSFGDEPEYPTQFHFTFGAQRGDETYDDTENLTIHDIEGFDAMYQEMTDMLKEFGLETDHHRFHKFNPRNLTNHLDPESENFTIRMAAEFTLRHPHRVLILTKMAEIMHRHFSPDTPMPDWEQFKETGGGYEL